MELSSEITSKWSVSSSSFWLIFSEYNAMGSRIKRWAMCCDSRWSIPINKILIKNDKKRELISQLIKEYVTSLFMYKFEKLIAVDSDKFSNKQILIIINNFDFIYFLYSRYNYPK